MFYAIFGILSHFLQFYTSFPAIQPNVFRMTDIRPVSYTHLTLPTKA